jgi:hypothetical protein
LTSSANSPSRAGCRADRAARVDVTSVRDLRPTGADRRHAHDDDDQHSQNNEREADRACKKHHRISARYQQRPSNAASTALQYLSLTFPTDESRTRYNVCSRSPISLRCLSPHPPPSSRLHAEFREFKPAGLDRSGLEPAAARALTIRRPSRETIGPADSCQRCQRSNACFMPRRSIDLKR